MRRALFLLATVFGLCIGYRFLSVIVPASGAFTEFQSKAVEQCHAVEVAPGPEDIEIDHDTGWAYISAAHRREGEQDKRGGLYRLDLKDPNARPVRLLDGVPGEFSPHGLSIWYGQNAERRLFVINHLKHEDVVEIFDIDADHTLTHRETVRFDEMYSPNDVVAAGARQFYVSNDRRYTEGLGAMLELYLGLPLADIAYFDGEVGRTAASGFSYANGINISKDGKTLYVAEVIGRNINVFNRDPVTGAVSGRRRFAAKTALDNIDIGTDGYLYIGGHPNLLAFAKHTKSAHEASPSQVVRMDPDTGKVETVFMSVKGEINGSATGAFWNGHLLIGGVYDSHILWCTDLPQGG
ncbi:MAG: SMP-30/gluconolactonase/LRE family protein [Pseudomonadota bacterium]